MRCSAPPYAPAASVEVHGHGGTDRDHRLVCTGSIRAATFLIANGWTPNLRIRVEFKDAVLFDVADTDIDVGVADRASLEPERIFGMYRRDQQLVLLTTESSPWLRAYTYFGLPMTEEMLTSMVAHEVTHALSKSLYESSLQAPAIDSQVQDQYLAYVVQLATMAPGLRDAVLGNFPAHLHAFEGEQDINAWSLALGPESFGVKSYRHFTGQGGGPSFIARLFSGAFRPPAFFDYVY